MGIAGSLQIWDILELKMLLFLNLNKQILKLKEKWNLKEKKVSLYVSVFSVLNTAKDLSKKKKNYFKKINKPVNIFKNASDP